MTRDTTPAECLATVVIPTLNRHRLLARRLPIIAKAGFDEIILVDSTREPKDVEATRGLCQSLGVRYLNRDCRRSEARNIGAKVARGAWLLFCDDDGFVFTGLDRDRLGDLVNKLDVLTFEGHLAWIFRREFFLRIGGYDQGLVAGEDDDITRRAIAQGRHGPAEGIITGRILHLDAVESRSDRIRRLKNQFEYGVTMLAFASRHPSPWSVVEAVLRKARRLISFRSEETFTFKGAALGLLLLGLALSPGYLLAYRVCWRSTAGSSRVSRR